MKPATVLFIVLLVLCLVQTAFSLERFKLQDSRIRMLEDRIELIQNDTGTDRRSELRHAL